MELPRRKKAKKNKYMASYPQGILDIIQTYYPDRYCSLSENPETFFSLETLFSEEEWIDILSRSRLSYEQWIKLKKQRIRNIK
jgi:hypothetical protein